MKKSNDFSSYFEKIKSDLNNLMNEISEFENNTGKDKSLKKSKKNSKTVKNKSYGFESAEGKSKMTSSMEGVGYEGVSMEGKSMMTSSMEGKSMMNNSFDDKDKIFDESSMYLNKKIQRKNKRLKLEDKSKLSDAIILSEIIGKPKALR